MTKQLVGLLQVTSAVTRRRSIVDIELIAHIAGEHPEVVLASMRKLARWGLLDQNGRVTALGEWLTVRVRTPGSFVHELEERRHAQPRSIAA